MKKKNLMQNEYVKAVTYIKFLYLKVWNSAQLVFLEGLFCNYCVMFHKHSTFKTSK